MGACQKRDIHGKKYIVINTWTNDYRTFCSGDYSTCTAQVSLPAGILSPWFFNFFFWSQRVYRAHIVGSGGEGGKVEGRHVNLAGDCKKTHTRQLGMLLLVSQEYIVPQYVPAMDPPPPHPMVTFLQGTGWGARTLEYMDVPHSL